MLQRPSLHDALVEQLVADARPVRHLWRPRTRLASWLVFESVSFAVVTAFGLRTTVLPKLGDGVFVVQVALLLLGSAIAAHLALCASVPDLVLDARERVASMVLIVTGLLLALLEPAHGAASVGQFLARGAQCTCSVLGVAALPCGLLLWAQRRGAPLSGRTAGVYAGAAALGFAAAAIRVACPIDERLHLAVWHLGPIAAGIALSTVAGARWLEQWDRVRVKQRIDRA